METLYRLHKDTSLKKPIQINQTSNLVQKSIWEKVILKMLLFQTLSLIGKTRGVSIIGNLLGYMKTKK